MKTHYIGRTRHETACGLMVPGHVRPQWLKDRGEQVQCKTCQSSSPSTSASYILGKRQ